MRRTRVKFVPEMVMATLLACATLALAATPTVRQLPRTDAFRKTVDSIGSKLLDEIISTGSLDVGAMIVTPHRAVTPTEARALNLQVAGQIARARGDKLPKGLGAKVSVTAFSPAAVSQAAKYLAEVNAYDPRSGAEKELAKKVWVMVGKLDLKDHGTVVTSRTKFHDDSSESDKHLTTMLFLNTQTGLALALYMVEGEM
jgi:uncharacterized protein with GYD domain